MSSKVYKIYKIIKEDIGKLIFSSSNLDEAIEEARYYLKYKPSPQELGDLKKFFKKKSTEVYTFSANDRTVRMELIRNY